MNNQEIFDTVVNHLRAQGRKSINESSGVCLYRGPDGTKCAAGILIPDELYKPEMEGNNFGFLISNMTRDRGEFQYSHELAEMFLDTNTRYFISLLQSTHDSYDIKDWEKRFANLAREFALVYTPPEAT